MKKFRLEKAVTARYSLYTTLKQLKTNATTYIFLADTDLLLSI